ncbi:MAG: hypothetical protein EA381_01965 [Planctomycetaceae bacterium]|nr:MAG: hypothetical protein EA381_01965 [Planctomycetaceae bacterium]
MACLRRFMFIAAWLACCTPFTLGDEPPVRETIDRLLMPAVLEADTTLVETRALVEKSVPRMPAVESLEQWQAEADRMRAEVLENVVFRGEAARWRTLPTRVEWVGDIPGGDADDAGVGGYRIRKLRYEVVPGLTIPALLYEPTGMTPDDRRPVVLNVNGHDGQGKAANYKQLRCINLAKRGMLALNVEWLGMGQLRGAENSHAVMNQLDLCGTSGLAPFYLSMSRGIDLLLEHPNADPQRVAVAGLSGGGWQTITISSLDTRVTLANPVAGYSSFLTRNQHTKDLGDSEQTPTDLATVADYTHLTAMLAPRATLLTFNTKDNCCFEAGYALPPLMAAAEPIFRLYGRPDRLRTHLGEDPGDHNFGLDNREAFYRMLGDHFYDGDPAFVTTEIPSESELKSAEQIEVPLPKGNASLNSLAKGLAESLPRDAALPSGDEPLEAWQTPRRQTLRKLVRTSEFPVTAEVVGEETAGGITSRRLRLKLGETWTVGAIELTRQGTSASSTVLVVSESGLASAGEAVTAILARGDAVLAVDPFYFGQSQFPSHGYLQALLVATIGERAIGIQASQITSIGRWVASRDGAAVELMTLGHRTAPIGLISAALEPQAIRAVTSVGARASLREVIEKNEPVTAAPEAFCFGLLEHFDVPQLGALIAPRPLTFAQTTDRHAADWEGLSQLYQREGATLTLAP